MRSTSATRIHGLAVSLALALVPVAFAGQSQLPELDPAVDREFSDLLEAPPAGAAAPVGVEEMQARMRQCGKRLQGELGPEGFVVQCLLASVEAERMGKGASATAVPMMVLGQTGVPPRALARALAPLWTDGDYLLRKHLRRALAVCEHDERHPGSGPPDFSLYAQLLREEAAEPGALRTGLVDYLFDRAPLIALETMLEGEASASSRVAALEEHREMLARAEKAAGIPAFFETLVRPARPVLIDLVREGGRWEAVYVAEMLQLIPSFRDAALEQLIRRHAEPLADLRLDREDPVLSAHRRLFEEGNRAE
jgi:hypothetical protein